MFLTVIGVFFNILLFFLVLSIVICIHELGHLFFAKRAGVLCHEFAFGMGPRLWSKKIGETTYSIRAVPFGGFVSMAGEEIEASVVKVGQKIRIGLDADGAIKRIVVNHANLNFVDFPVITVTEMDLQGIDNGRLFINEYTVRRDAFYVFDKQTIQIAPFDRNFANKTKMQRFLTTVGGPLMNLLLAIFLFLFIAFVFGVSNPDSTVISQTSEGMPAAAEIMAGDEVVAINGIAVESWANPDSANSIISVLHDYENNESYVFTVIRDGEEITLNPIRPYYFFYGLGFYGNSTSSDLTILGPLYKNSPFLENDVILSINGNEFTTWDQVINYQLNDYLEGSTKGNLCEVNVLRDGVETELSYVAYGEKVVTVLGQSIFTTQIGIAGSSYHNFLASIKAGLNASLHSVVNVYQTLWLLISNSQISLSDMSGFI